MKIIPVAMIILLPTPLAPAAAAIKQETPMSHRTLYRTTNIQGISISYREAGAYRRDVPTGRPPFWPLHDMVQVVEHAPSLLGGSEFRPA